MKTFIQIGANIGNDYFYNIIQRRKSKTRVILVEPNKELIQTLKDNYSSLLQQHEIHFVEGGIVSDKNHNELNIYSEVGNDNVVSGLSSIINRKSYNHKIKSITFTPYTFTELCKTFDMKDVELLMIDTEGYDYMILSSLNLDEINIKCIICEKWIHDVDSSNDIQTGPLFFESVIRPKYKNFTIKELDIAHDPNYIFYANT